MSLQKLIRKIAFKLLRSIPSDIGQHTVTDKRQEVMSFDQHGTEKGVGGLVDTPKPRSPSQEENDLSLVGLGNA